MSICRSCHEPSIKLVQSHFLICLSGKFLDDLLSLDCLFPGNPSYFLVRKSQDLPETAISWTNHRNSIWSLKVDPH